MHGDPMTPIDLLSRTLLPPALRGIFLTPAMTRLEPQSVSGDPGPGADACVADPLWAIGRQWQIGELRGEDAGTPVSVTVGRRALPVAAWAPLGEDETEAKPEAWRPWPEGAVLDELVEHVPHAAAEEGLRWRAETGAQLADMLSEAGHGKVVAAMREAHPLTLPVDESDPKGALDPVADLLFEALDGAVADGAAVREALAGGAKPHWLAAGGKAAAALDVARRWLAWVDGAPGAGGAWSTPRLEHRFLVRFGEGKDTIVLRATAFGQGSARWHDFEWVEGMTGGEDDGERPAESATETMLATPLRYPGMPCDRYWQFEDGAVDIAAIEAQPHDLVRLCLAEFALAGGDDWLVLPVDGRLGAVNQIESVTVTTNFPDPPIVIDDARAERHERGFSMFEVGAAEGGEPLAGLVLPPVASTPLLGDPVEEVAFLRDETANLGWAVERIVPGRSGDPRPRAAEGLPRPPDFPDDFRDEDLLYELQVPTPHNWIPLVPFRLGPAKIVLRKGAMLDDDGARIKPVGLLLRPTPLTFPPEEIPREGIAVRAVPALARRRDGTYARWTGHRISVGRGEGNSGLASDAARHKAPNRLPPEPPDS